MNRLLRPITHRYGTWMDRWENDLCFRATDRTVRPFEFGLEWSRSWPCSAAEPLNGSDPIDYLVRLNECAIQNSAAFFGYQTPEDFELRGDWVEFSSPVVTPFPENNLVRARLFPSRSGRRTAVIVLPHWNSKLPQHNALCAGLQRLGVSVLRLSLPYHDSRMPAGLTRADYAVSSNICRTIDAARQAIIDTRCCVDWLETEGYSSIGIVGTSLGSCYAFLASAHD